MRNRAFFLIFSAMVVASAATGCAHEAAAPPKTGGSPDLVDYPSGGAPGGPTSVIWPQTPAPFPPSPQSPSSPTKPTFKVNDQSGKRLVKEGEVIVVEQTRMMFFSREDMSDNCGNVRTLNLTAKTEAGICLVFVSPHLQGLKPGDYPAAWQVGDEKVSFKLKVVPSTNAAIAPSNKGLLASIGRLIGLSI
ncbi:hypothetical protein IT412_01625 [Candidatus Peregrinibacteria bacterium]|nr:hypothetical protein [Candidatus Peregrinibacteria bacterium]